MGKWKVNSCPRCGGSLFVDRDMDGWYEQCINCSYRNELKLPAEFNLAPVKSMSYTQRSSPKNNTAHRP
jgi:ribosomal protein S27AE